VSAPAHAVVIPSTRRPDLVAATLGGLRTQTRPADVIVLCVANAGDVPADLAVDENVRLVYSQLGSSVQRNTAVASLPETPGLVTFMDDDAVLADDYFEKMRSFMDREPDVVLMTGAVVADGIHDGEIDRLAALERLRGSPGTDTVRDIRRAYGCNMTARGWVAAAEPFDERMRLYGWQEDADFSVRCGRHGRVVLYLGCVAVHLAVGSGRVRGREFGFAQIVNPFYMWRKGTKTGRELLHDWCIYLGANIVHYRERDRPDRQGRLAGNLLGLKEVALHGGRPEAIALIGPSATDRRVGRRKDPR
jgi:GT2 family glycosyltransferase